MSDIISEFLDYASNRNENTYGNTRTAVNHYQEWLDNRDPREINALDMEAFARYLKSEKGLAEKTCMRYIRSVSNLYEYLKKREEIEDNPVYDADIGDQFDSPNETQRSKELREDYFALSPEEMETMIDNVPTPKFRNQLIFKILGQTGCRPGELTDIRIQDVKDPKLWDNNRIRIRAEKTQNNRTVRYGDSLKFYLRQWLEQGERDQFYYAGESEYLFPTQNSESISNERIEEITRQTAEEAGLQEVVYTDAKGASRYKVTAYAFRHGFAEEMVRNGCDIARLKKLMGHSDISMTQKYLDPDESALDETTEYVPDI